MNLSQWSLHHRVFTSVLALCALVGGFLSYGRSRTVGVSEHDVAALAALDVEAVVMAAIAAMARERQAGLLRMRLFA